MKSTLARVSLVLLASVAFACGGPSPPESKPPASSASTAQTAPTKPPPPAPPVEVRVAIGKDGAVVFDGKPVEQAELTARAREAAARQPIKVVVDAEKDAPYQTVMGLMDRIREAGVRDVSLASSGGMTSLPAKPEGARTGPAVEPHAELLEPPSRWKCKFPKKVDRGEMKDAKVLVKVNVDETGKPLTVDVIEDPGGGFGAAAQRCAMEKKYAAGKSEDGGPVRASTFPFYLEFYVQ